MNILSYLIDSISSHHISLLGGIVFLAIIGLYKIVRGADSITLVVKNKNKK